MRSLPVAGVALLVVLSAGTASAQLDAQPVRSFVTKVYFEGLPYHEARTYGADVLPQLHAMLREPELDEYWPNIVGMIGYLGDASSVEPLMAFLDGFEGEIPVLHFRAILEVMPALGHIAGSGDSSALQTLIANTNRDHWRAAGYTFSCRRYFDEVLGEVLGRKAIQGLGISGAPGALVHLESMQAEGKAPGHWSDNLSEAIAMNREAGTRGIASLFRR